MEELKRKLSNISLDRIKKLEARAFNDGFLGKSAVNRLVRSLPIVETDSNALGPLYRCRISQTGEGHAHVKSLMWPSKSNGQFHRLGTEAVTYFASNVPTALVETLPTDGSEVLRNSCVSIKSDQIVRMYCVGDILRFVQTDSLTLTNDKKAYLAFKRLLSMLSNEEVLKFALLDAIEFHLISSRNRSISRATSSALFNYISNDSIFCFPSTRQPGGINFGIKPSTVMKKFKICGGVDIEFAESLGYGLIDIRGNRVITNIDQDGTIEWGKPDQSIFSGSSLLPRSFEKKWVNDYE